MIIAVVSKKGGVGKTTTSVNLGAGLARLGKRVLVVDLDPNGGASRSLGAPRTGQGTGSGDLILHGAAPVQALRRTTLANLHVIPASDGLRSIELHQELIRGKVPNLGLALQIFRRRYDIVLLDCPSSLGPISQCAVAASDNYMLPAAPEFLAVDTIDRLILEVERFKPVWDSHSKLLGILLTMVDYRSRNTAKTMAALRERYGPTLFAIEIRQVATLAEAPAAGKSIFEYRPQSTGALAYSLLAEEFLMRDPALDRLPVSLRRQRGRDPDRRSVTRE